MSALRGNSATNGNRIHIARPWLKKKSPVLEESSEEENDKLNMLQGALRGHERRATTLQRLESENGRITSLKAKFNQRFGQTFLKDAVRSDGITDDDDDVVY